MTPNETEQNAQPANHGAAVEPRIVRDFAFEALREQRLARRWGIFFKGLAFVYLLLVIILAVPGGVWMSGLATEEHTALVDIDGVITPDSPANADTIVAGLRKAFENEKAAGIILRINSPGGSPVQSGYINDEIVRLREQHPDTRVIAVIADICASGGYYIASAADEIYADKASIVGSIGVRMDSFGFVDAIAKLGVERRLLTAGDNKGFLDPFQPLHEAHVGHVRGILDTVHEQFINTVKRGRGDRLSDDEQLFSGLFWTGEQSLALGLVDALGSAGYVAREVIGAEKIVDYTVRGDLLTRLGRRFGAAVADALLTNVMMR